MILKWFDSQNLNNSILEVHKRNLTLKKVKSFFILPKSLMLISINQNRGMPHDFILDYLYPLEVRIKKMFGTHSLYLGNKILLAARDNKDKPTDNGLWIGTSVIHHESLKAEFPSLTNLKLYNIKKWLLLPDTADDFEETAIKICELIKKEDERIGVIVNK